jgi:aspartate carbamoyltransferase catalytic subunit
MKHFLGCENLSKKTIEAIFEKADRFRSYVDHKERAEPLKILKGALIVSIFFEPSTRTRASFEISAKRLGADVVHLNPQGSSESKGESLLDTIRNIEAMKPQAVVIRHNQSGILQYLSKSLDIPLVNAGDGFHEHPSQALLDLFSIRERLDSLEGKNVLIVGDIAHSRVARSNIYALKKFGAKITLCGPSTLLPPECGKWGVNTETDLNACLPEADVLMMLRIQSERHGGKQFPSAKEYSALWGLDESKAHLLKKTALLMHPGPVNPGVELSHGMIESKHSIIFDQVRNSIPIRMAILEEVTENWHMDGNNSASEQQK